MSLHIAALTDRCKRAESANLAVMFLLPESAHHAARQGPLFIVLNAASGHKDSTAERELLTEVFNASGRPFEFLPIDNPSNIAGISARAVSLAQEKGGVVVAAGGDGTINAVAAAVLRSQCPFGVLPQGTFNYFGRTHGIPQDTRAAATALLGASISPVPVGEVNGRIFLVNASLGLYPQLLENRETWKQKLGRSRLVAFASGLATIVRARGQLRLEIDFDGKTTALLTPTLFIGNNHLQLAQVGIDAPSAENVKDVKDVSEAEAADVAESNRLTAVVVAPTGTFAMLGLLARGAIGRLGEADNITSFPFGTLKVSVRRKRRVKVATDGEVIWLATPLVFQVADTPLLLMVPAPAARAEVA